IYITATATTEIYTLSLHDALPILSEELEQTGLIECRRYFGPRIQFQATYSGLVWETRRGFTLMSKFIDELVAEWETTNVDFKRRSEEHTSELQSLAYLVCRLLLEK